MFSVLKIFVIYLVIPSYTSTLPIDDTKEVTVKNSKAVDELNDMFDDLVNHISDDKNKQMFKGVLKFVAKYVERNAKVLLEKEKERSDLYRVLLGIGHRIDVLEQVLSSGSGINLRGPRNKRWESILKLQTISVQEFRNKIIAAGLTIDEFTKGIQLICQERNDRAGYYDVSLPESLKSQTIDEFLTKMKIPKDEHFKRIIEILLSPLTLPSRETPSTLSPSNSSPSKLTSLNSAKNNSDENL